MRIRKLEEKDAPNMEEWMKDERVNEFFRFDPDKVTRQSVLEFINNNRNPGNSYNFAIVDNQDIYLGTVSLKNVDFDAKNAEYAISLRTSAQGKGVGRFATIEILKFAFERLGLERVYLNVLTENKNAICFYQKLGFVYEGEFLNHIHIKGKIKSIKWFRMMKSEFEESKNNLWGGCDDRTGRTN